MQQICLYFSDKQVYDIENMNIIDTFPNGKQKTLYQHMKMIREQYDIQVAVIDFHQPLRNTIYSLFPNVIIMIHPIYVLHMMNQYLAYVPYNIPIMKVGEEIAAGLEGQVVLEDTRLTCYDLYRCDTKREAMNYYKEWQSQVPLTMKCLHHIIRKIDFYYDEIFNYFDYKYVIDTTNECMQKAAYIGKCNLPI